MTRVLRRLARLAGLGLLLAAASGAHAQTCPLVVDPAGGGHFTDIQRAVDHFKSSLGNLGPCTIEVRAGSYPNSVSLDGVNAGASSDAQRLVIRGVRTAGGGYASVLNTGRRDAIRVRSSRYVTLRDFEVLTGTNKPFAIEGGSAANRGITVDSNDFHDNGGGRDSGCVFVGDSNVDSWVVNNVCWSNGSDAIAVGKGGPSYVVNNTVFMNRKSGIVVTKGANAVVANNLVLFNTLTGIVLSTGGGGANGDRRLLHNVVYGNAAGDLTGQSTATANAGNQTTATLGAGLLATHFLEDPAAGNFRLASSSPALNAGIASTGTPNRVPGDDFEGDPRSDATPDVGIDEVTDADHDGVPDLADNCPPGLNSSYNPAQGDADDDGVGNYCDNCPDVHNPEQTDVSGFDAFGNPTGAPNGRGDACEGVGESLFEVSPGPAADLVFVATFGILEPTDTVAPSCGCNTYFYCEDGAGNRLPRTHTFCSRGIPDDLVPYAAGSQVTVACPLPELFPLAAFGDGTYTCKACYDNEHRDLDLREDGSCPSGGCVSNFEGLVCSAPQALVIDASIARNGCSPGYWRNHLERWNETEKGGDPDQHYAPADDFDATFGVNLFSPDVTLGQAVELGGGGANELARHGTAALLSATHPGVHYPYGEDAVKALVKQGDPDGRLAAANSLGCPLN
jgi:parallel beta-helix repeat protein